MISRSIRAGNVCLRCQARVLEGPRPNCVARHRVACLPTQTRLARWYSSRDIWSRLTDASRGESTQSKKEYGGPAEWEKPTPSKSKSRAAPPTQEASKHSEKAFEKPFATTEEAQEDPDDPNSLYQQLMREMELDMAPLMQEASKPSAAAEDLEGHPNDPDASHHQPTNAISPSPKPEIVYTTDRQEPIQDEYNTYHRGRIGSRRVVLKPEGLDITVLGAKAHTIVMRDEKRTKPRREIMEDPDHPKETDPDAPRTNLQALLENAEAGASVDEAIANIEEMRPEGTLIPRSDFWAIHQDLSEGFTSNQLLYYIAEKRKAAAAKKVAGKTEQVSPSSKYGIRPLEQIVVGPEMGPKQRKALALMLGTWKVDIWERVEGPSEAAVVVKDPTVAMVLNTGRERNRRLKDLRGFLQAGESLVWNPQNQTLTITARRAIIETIMGEIENITSNVVEGSFVLLPPGAIKPKEEYPAIGLLLDRLCGHTEAAYAYDRAINRNGKVRVMSANSAQAGESSGLEDMTHTMWRLLYTALSRPQSSITVLPSLQEGGHGRLNLHTENDEKLAWKDRMASWGRWILPVDRESIALSSVDGLANKLSVFDGEPANRKTGTSPTWPPSQASISTTFGHVLFDAERKIGDIQSLLTSTTGLASTPSVLAPVTPPPEGLKLLDTMLGDRSATTTMVLRFAAGPDHAKTPLLAMENGSLSLHPDSTPRYVLELHLEVPEDMPDDGVLAWEVSPRKFARAILSTKHTDLPLPDLPVDMRITRVQDTTLADVDSIPALRDFINASSLGLSRGSLRTPPTLRVPQDALADLPLSSEQGVDENLEFIGLELRRAVQFPLAEHTLSYTSIEAGLHGGRRAEITLAMTPAEGGVEDAEHQQQYLDLAMSLASGNLVQWGDGPRSIAEDTERRE